MSAPPPPSDSPPPSSAKKSDDDPANANSAPQLSPVAVFFLFLKFGMRAFGGPVAQINDQREELVVKGKWITQERFTRVFALYQLLPGPEATELACYFGRLAGGRLGGIAGGLGFITPGMLLMLLFSWFYSRYGIQNAVFLAVFKGLQPAMAALVFRAVHKIGDFAFRDHKTKDVDWGLVAIGALSAFETVLNVNYFISKIHLVLVYALILKSGVLPDEPVPSNAILWKLLLGFWTIAPLLVFIGVIGAYGKLDNLVPMGMGIAKNLGNTPAGQFVVGLVAGLVTFGGAYTAIPFVEYETVVSGAWIPNKVFLDSLVICSVLPTPMVMFILMIGYVSGLARGSDGDALIGAALMTLGMFIPAFIMPVCFNDTLERIVGKGGATAKFLDAIAATVVGQIAITALVLLRTAVTMPTQAVLFFGTLQFVYSTTNKCEAAHAETRVGRTLLTLPHTASPLQMRRWPSSLLRLWRDRSCSTEFARNVA
jgi:putative chromate ion transporter